MGHPQVTKMYNEEKLHSIRSLVVVNILNFQRDLIVMQFIRIELIICLTSKVDRVKVHNPSTFPVEHIISSIQINRMTTRSRWKFRICTTTNDLTLYSFSLYIFVTWGWPTVAETCRQPNKTDTKTAVFWRTYPLLICTKHNTDDAPTDQTSKSYRTLHHVDWSLFTSWHSIKYSQTRIFITAVRTLTYVRNNSPNSLKHKEQILPFIPISGMISCLLYLSISTFVNFLSGPLPLFSSCT